MKTQSTLKQSTLKINTSKTAAPRAGAIPKHSSTNKTSASSASTNNKSVTTHVASAVAASSQSGNGIPATSISAPSGSTSVNATKVEVASSPGVSSNETFESSEPTKSEQAFATQGGSAGMPKAELFADVFKRNSRTNTTGRRLYLVPQHATPESVDFAGSEPTILRPNQKFYDFEKRATDIIGALLMLVVLSPVMVILSAIIYLTSGAPIIYRQQRLTVGGKQFTIFKFRTMKVGAEKATGPVFATENDPRVTKLGRFMRRTRLDELPQLFNVLFGSMSLIGPRPERPELAQQLEDSIPRFHQRLRAKAGLTGLAQVHQGYPDGVDGYRRKLALDLLYIKKQSVVLDIWIAVRTIGVVFSGSGAR